MEIIHLSKDKSWEVKLTYISKTVPKYYGGFGNKRVKYTQCIMFVNGLIVGYGEVAKHESDTDNQRFSYIEATKRVMGKITFKSDRKEIWEKVLNEIKNI